MTGGKKVTSKGERGRHPSFSFFKIRVFYLHAQGTMIRFAPSLVAVGMTAFVAICFIINPLVIPVFERFPCTANDTFDVIAWPRKLAIGTGIASVFMLFMDYLPELAMLVAPATHWRKRWQYLVAYGISLALAGAVFIALASAGIGGMNKTVCRNDTFAVALNIVVPGEYFTIPVGSLPDPQLNRRPDPILDPTQETSRLPNFFPDRDPINLPSRPGEGWAGGLLGRFEDGIFVNVPIPPAVQAFFHIVLNTPFLWIFYMAGMVLTLLVGGVLLVDGILTAIGNRPVKATRRGFERLEMEERDSNFDRRVKNFLKK